MHISIQYLKYLFENKKVDENIYNNQVVTAIEQKLIKDVTPKSLIMGLYQVVGAVVEFPDGTKFRIDIFNPPDLGNPNNDRYNYKVEIEKVGNII